MEHRMLLYLHLLLLYDGTKALDYLLLDQSVTNEGCPATTYNKPMHMLNWHGPRMDVIVSANKLLETKICNIALAGWIRRLLNLLFIYQGEA